jgi:pyridoxamine 5'-phosphate oxidase-like protein
MARWQDIAAEQPDLADHVRRCFAIRKHATLATLRRDGSPRISGTEVEWAEDGEVYLGMMPGSMKALDLRRNPRFALHCPTEDTPEQDPGRWLGDAKLAGVAIEVSAPARSGAPAPHRFRLDVTEVVVTSVASTGDHLQIDSWHPDSGLRRRQRA